MLASSAVYGPPVVMAVTRVVDESGRVIEYERRRPENSVNYRIVQEHIQTVFFASRGKRLWLPNARQARI